MQKVYGKIEVFKLTLRIIRLLNVNRVCFNELYTVNIY
jgi:hypothetical protein